MAGKLRLAVSLAVLAALAARFWQHLDAALDLSTAVNSTHPPLGCVRLTGPVGAEDVATWEDVGIVTELNSLRLWSWPWPPAGAPPSGTLWFLESSDGKEGDESAPRHAGYTARPLDLASAGFPADVPFFSHGAAVLGNRLWVGNHAGPTADRVEVFELSRGAGGEVAAKHVSSHLGGPERVFSRELAGTLNAVAPVNNKGDFFVSEWLPYPSWPASSRGGTVQDAAKVAYMLLGPLFGLKWTRLYFCKAGNGACTPVGDPANSWNGLAFVPPMAGDDDTPLGRLVAVDAMERELAVYRIASADGVLALERRIPTGSAVDNVRWDPVGRRVWGGGMAKAGACFFGWLDHHVHSQTEPSGGGPGPSGELCPAAAISVDIGTGEVRSEGVHDGSMLAAVSAAVPLSPHIYALGSFADAGVLVCERKER